MLVGIYGSRAEKKRRKEEVLKNTLELKKGNLKNKKRCPKCLGRILENFQLEILFTGEKGMAIIFLVVFSGSKKKLYKKTTIGKNVFAEKKGRPKGENKK